MLHTLVPALLLVAPPASPPAPLSTRDLVSSARVVRAAIVEAARENRHRPLRTSPDARPPFRRTGDELTVFYVRAAARAARTLPPDQAGPAFLLALGVSLDSTDLIRKNPVTGPLWKQVETDAERAARLAVLGEPAMHGRHDLCLHFAVSCALTATGGARAAEAAGILKEILDSNGGSGFSFADLAADLSGVAFAEMVLKQPDQLVRMGKEFSIEDFAVGPRGLVEGLTRAQFEKRYGSVSDPRFRDALEALKGRVRALPGHQPSQERPAP
jgi:hypothetical protein